MGIESLALFGVIGVLLWRVTELERKLLDEKRTENSALERLVALSVTQAAARSPQEAALVTSLLQETEKPKEVPIAPTLPKKFPPDFDVLYDPNGVFTS